MRRLALRALIFNTALAATALVAPGARAANPDVNGNWKLMLVGPFRESELLLLDVKDHAGKVVASIKDYPKQQFREVPIVSGFATHKGAVTFGVDFGVKGAFKGKTAKDGSITGVLSINDQAIPTRLVKTDAQKLEPGPTAAPESMQAYMALRAEKDLKAKATKLAALIAKNPGSPTLAMIYTDLFKSAGAAGFSLAEVKKFATERIEGIKIYDADLGTSVTAEIVNDLSSSKELAPLALELATGAEKELAADAPVATKASLATALAAAARAAGNKELLAKAEGQVKMLDAALDTEYHKKVPPFKPEISAAGKDRKSDRVVVMELFTGAQCPPCVAADVAFDALISTYKTKELITLQYHEHIPGPDPLTNGDSQVRFKYYPGLRGTPSVLFDGKNVPEEVAGGGGMGDAKMKYDQYRPLIDKELERPSEAKLNLKVDRIGDAITINASAQAEDAKSDQLKLRLVLVEDVVRYTGGNKLRFHHHVVRGLPGGVEGKALSKGQGKTEVTVNLAEVRKGLEQYLSDFTKAGRAFPKDLPPINLDKLSVVAFVQDDSNQAILNAAVLPVAEKAPTP